MLFRSFQLSLLKLRKQTLSSSLVCSMQTASSIDRSLYRPRVAFTRLGPCGHVSTLHRQHTAAGTSLQAAASTPETALDLDTVLARVRQAVQGSHPLCRAKGNRNGMVYGEGVHMGLPVVWAFFWRPDGAWYEEVRGQQLTYKWGYDGAGNCWEVDPYGVSKVLEKDDHESSVLGALIRSGNWLVPELAAQHLELKLEHPPLGSNGHFVPSTPEMPAVAVTWWVDPGRSWAPTTPAAVAAAAATTAAAAEQHQHHHQQQMADSSSSSSSSSSCVAAVCSTVPYAVEQAPEVGGGDGVQQQQPEGCAEGGEVCGSSGSRSRRRSSKGSVYVTIRLKTGRMIARVQVSVSTWRPVSYKQPFCSDTEAWLFEDWNNWTQQQQQQQQQQQAANGSNGSSIHHSVADVFYPRRVKHLLCQGVANTYETVGGITQGAELHKAYQLPVSPTVPVDVQYLDTVSPVVPVWQTHQGHLLVQAHLNQRMAGWMLIDTGASGFVIEPSVADHFKLPHFGHLSIAGIAGKVPTRYRRASQLRLGPLVLSDPVMLEMSISNIVGQFHDNVIGIAGYDVFRRCRVTVPCHNTRKAIQKATSRNGQVSFFNADLHTPAAAKAAAHPWPPTAAQQQQLAAMTSLQQGLAGASGSSGNSHSTAGTLLSTAAAAPAAVRSRRRSSSSSSLALGSKRRQSRAAAAALRAAASPTAAAAAATTAVQQEQPQQELYTDQEQQQQQLLQLPSVLQKPAENMNGSSSNGVSGVSLLQQQQQAVLLQLPPVPVPPPVYSSADDPMPTALIEVLLHKPLVTPPHLLEDGYIWQEITMIASLPHVELEFKVPGQPANQWHKSLFLVDTGAGGAEVMFHSRAARELKLLDHDDAQYKGWGEGLAELRTVSGVGADLTLPIPFGSDGSDGSTSQPPPAASTLSTAGVGCQAGKLPELVIRGQFGSDPSTQGALQLSGVRSLFNRSGGLDISLYSAGMVCADLLSRMQVVYDYPNKRIGWKVPPPGALAQLQQQQQQQ